MKKTNLFLILSLSVAGLFAQKKTDIQWVHLSSKNGDLETVNNGKEQTSTLVFDIDKDGLNDFASTERTKSPSYAWFKRTNKGWQKYVIEDKPLHIEAGTDYWDIDNDGDLDIVGGGDYAINELWWWENPYPEFNPKMPWKRRIITKMPKNKSHDQMFGDFDGDGKAELMFWNQDNLTLCMAEIPENPKENESWDVSVIYKWSNDSEMEQHGSYPWFKAINEHEGAAKADIDGDGIIDFIGGGLWFKYTNDGKFQPNVIDAGYTFSRSAAGDLIKGGRPEVILVVGDGNAPMIMYEWVKGTWKSKVIVEDVEGGHTLKILDFNNDGNLDIWNAEMRLDGGNPDSKNYLLLGDGKGNFEKVVISEGISLHESKIADLDGDGDFDILGKPYGWETPRLDIWLQNGTGEVISQRKGAFNQPYGISVYSLRDMLQEDLPGTLAKIKAFGFKNVEVPTYFDYTPEQIKNELDNAGLTCTSLMFPYERYEDDINGIIEEVKLFGAKQTGIGWIPHNFDSFNIEDAKKSATDFNKFGAALKDAGIDFFYHPHGYEFNYYENGTLLDYMMENTDAESVHYQLDLFWAQFPGVDPVVLLNKYSDRFVSIHLKDMKKGIVGNFSGGAGDETSVPIGSGEINFPAVLRTASKLGITRLYLEDEAPNAIDQIPVSIKYMESLK